MFTITGKRSDDGIDIFELKPGEYAKYISPGGAHWVICPPVKDAEKSFGPCSISKHTVIEHEDGTITVSPSILISDNGYHPTWHGYLERGVWKEC